MSRRARTRAPARAAKELSLAPADPVDDDREDDTDSEGGEPDTRVPIGPLDCTRLTDAQLDAPWSLPA